MFRRTALSAAGALVLLAAASWLPAHATHAQTAAHSLGDLARPALPAPEVLPAAAPGPVPAVSGFFWSLAAAVGGERTAAAPSGTPPASSSAAAGAGPPSPAGTAPFARAYAYLSAGWQAGLPFAAFVRNWSATRALDLLAAIPAGAPPGDPRAEMVFVEVRTLTEVGAEAPRLVLGYASGFYTAEPGPKGWHLRGGGLTPEAFAPASAGAGAEAAAAGAAAALARRLGRPGAGAVPSVQVKFGEDHRAAATVRLGGDAYAVSLYQLVDGQWVAVRAAR